MNFSDALTAIKNGDRVCRSGWDGKGMFVFITDAYQFEYGGVGLKAYCSPVGDFLLESMLVLRAADGTFVPWLCSQTDMLADDWEIVR